MICSTSLRIYHLIVWGKMNLNERNLSEKPYNVCLDCIHIGKDCDGPNFLAMSAERWCEWCHLRKEYLGLTNSQIADSANIAEITVARIMSGKVKDIRMTTMQSVTKVLVNGSWGQYPCAMASVGGADSFALSDQCKQLQIALDAEKEARRKEVEDLRKYDDNRLDYLKQQIVSKDELLVERFRLIKSRDRVVMTLSILLGLAVLAVIAFLAVEIIDLTNPDWGRYHLTIDTIGHYLHKV